MRIIVDTNIVFSAILNPASRIGKVLLHSKPHFRFYTCSYLQTEILKHQNKLLKLTKLTATELTELQTLVMMNINFIDERLLPKDLLIETETLLQSIDPNDTPFVALTVHLEGKLWTGDMELYNGLKAKQFKDVLTTAELSLLLDELQSG